ncbi:putative uncharacterized transposon-derived protein F54H12.3 [Trichonephila clavipes]|nr:putative uncharacterized transposon-derived protein F54H12.3 [Trichonephila clavipes]
MAQEMGLVPKGLISRYFAETQPEVRIENNISSLLHEKETPDDIKAKLLSDLIPKYQRVMQPPPPPKPFEIPPELLTEPELPLTNKSEVPLRINILAKYIGYAIPKTRKKYILPILETLKDANYTFNDKNEFEVDGKAEYRSNVVDLFTYMMKNDQRVLTPPTGFAKFYAALRHVNIPLEWIGNKRLREQLLLSDANPAFTKITPRSPEIKKMEKLDRLRKLYFNPKEPSSFGGVKRLSKASGVHLNDVQKWLSQQDVYTLHKPVRYKFQRRKTIAYGINELWQSDLLDMQKLSRYNKGYRYILTIIDVMSRYLRAFPIKDKKASTIKQVLQKVFKKVKPKNFQTDKGTEFYNKIVRAMLKRYKIHHYSTKSETKCAILERAHRTLRERMYRAFTYRNSYKYYDILPELVHSYNHSIHRAHGFEPTKLTTDDEPELYKRLYHSNVDPQFSFTAGDIVRLSKARKTFRKGYLPGWTEETFRIYKRYPTIPPTYTLQDFNSNEIEGRFYNEELQK